jgi:hypothetical protein
VVIVEAQPEESYIFINWTGDVATMSNANAATTSITMNGNYSITANFAYMPPGQFALTIHSSPGGSVTTPGEGTFTYNEGTVVNLVATPDIDYYFVAWTGDVYSIDNVDAANTTITMYANYFITANFSQGQFIRDWYDLNGIRDDMDGYYILMNDLNSTTPGYADLASPTANGGEGWEPIGTSDVRFDGILDGSGYEIRDLYIYRTTKYVGLFGYVTNEGILRDIGMSNVTVTGYQNVGGLVGYTCGTVSNCYAAATVDGDRYIGGLVGRNQDGTVSNCYATGLVTGDIEIGGLMGVNWGTLNNCYANVNVTGNAWLGGLVSDNGGVVNSCHATGNVTGGGFVGGLVAENYEGFVSNCYATGFVNSSGGCAGGLMGENAGGTVTNSYAISSVTGSYDVGGLVGVSLSNGAVTNCYATGSVVGWERVGGLVGRNSWSTISFCYAVGNIDCDWDVGGLLGLNDYGTVTSSFWDTETSGQATSAGGTGKTTAEMQDIATFSGAAWDIVAVANPDTRNIAYIWNIVDDETYPFLSWEPVS